ncbi:RadC family protein [Ramlibacter alkalitolerans]|uniref:DNA repair protein RadC n=1 Tax=Ramlibacter alkalitolerans TaxID=2039631 RepID=A0ABS1JUT3_9BURK|nr:DNA repair protein RadC [Ramlibacter alkalitolerans]MBL0427978.1 DNA repair protein RadC [Ramlibacter alkalitolerans]
MTAAQPTSVRQRLQAFGTSSLTDAELVAVLLRTGDVGEPVKELSSRLIAEAGGLAELLCCHESMGRSGPASPNIRPELAVVLELARRAAAQQLAARDVFGSPDAVKHYLQLHLARRQHEVFAVLFLDSQNRLIRMEEMFRGTLTQTSVYPREVVLAALRVHAGAVILAHNHPSGTVQPSRADEALTQTIKAALALVDVRVLDHVVVAPGQALSMAEKGLI